MNLESEISGLQPLLREEIDRERERRLGELQGSLHELGNKELVLWEQSGEVVDELVAVWNSYRELLEQRSAIYQQAIHSGTLTMDDGDAYQEIQTLTKGPTSPACGTIITFIAKILDVTLDPDGLGYRDPGGRPPDQNRKLPGPLEDKRDRLQKLQLLAEFRVEIAKACPPPRVAHSRADRG